MERDEYAALIRAQLSRYELIWLYYNGLSEFGKEKLKPLLERFSMLKNLREELLVDSLELDIKYESNAFGLDK